MKLVVFSWRNTTFLRTDVAVQLDYGGQDETCQGKSFPFKSLQSATRNLEKYFKEYLAAICVFNHIYLPH